MACAGASNTSNFALFSLQIYTPAILLGMVGLLLVLREVFDYLERGRWRAISTLWIALGSAICLLSKPEYIVADAGILASLALCDLRVHYRARSFSSWLTAYVTLAIICFVPAIIVYVAVAASAGSANMLAGLGGYGMAALSCPWWPTGLGLFGAVAALAYGVIAVALLSLTRFQAFRAHYGSRYVILWALAAASLVIAIAYLPFCAELPMFVGGITVSHTLTYFLSTGTALIPVMWWSILLWAWLAVRLVRTLRTSASGNRPAPLFADAFLFIILTSAVFMSLRGLFNGTMSQLSLASVAAYPIWFLLGPLFLIRFLQSPDSPSTGNSAQPLKPSFAPLVVNALVAVFLVLRLAGTVRLKDTTVSGQVYAYIQSHAAPHEALLDLAGGGGINLADRRPSPIFSTQMSALAPPLRYLQLDETLIRQHPPRLVIATDAPNYDATYGICMNTGCVFPALVWRSARPACDSAVSFPVLDFIRQHYRPVTSFGDKVIYVRRDL